MRATDFVNSEILGQIRYLVLSVDETGRLAAVDDAGGQWDLEGLRIGEPLPEVLQAILGSRGDEPAVQRFPMVSLGPNIVADVHVLPVPGGIEVVLQDVGKRHELELRLQQKAHEISLLLEQQAELNRELDKRRAEAERASAAKSHFIASMSHEFRTPITAILGHVNLLSESVGESGSPSAIRRASWHLLALVENLLQQARQGEEQIPLNPSRFGVQGVVDSMQSMFANQAKARGLDFRVSGPDQDVALLTDELRLRQVLINLLGNAFRYTDQGKVELEIDQDNGALWFRVRDTGPGIAAHDLERIFEPFTRLRPEHGAGAGLGLTITRQLLAAMGSELTVRSTPGQGSEFAFRLPAATEPGLTAQSDLSNLHVLLVDDDPDVLALFELLLDEWGFHARGVTGKQQALKLAERHRFDLLLTDYHLEDGTGVELIQTMRQQQPACKSILCTGSGLGAVDDQDTDRLADAIIAKPVAPEHLKSVIEQTLEKRH